MTSTPELVNRHSQEFRDNGTKYMKLEDYVAFEIYVRMRSRGQGCYKDGTLKDAETIKKAEPFFNKGCVAIVFDSENRLYAAANSHNLKAVDIFPVVHELNTEKNMGIPEFIIVTEGTRNEMHAEMQLKMYWRKRNIPRPLRYIGVSKPCCMLCASNLDKSGTGYSMFHDDKVENWQSPDSALVLSNSNENDTESSFLIEDPPQLVFTEEPAQYQQVLKKKRKEKDSIFDPFASFSATERSLKKFSDRTRKSRC